MSNRTENYFFPAGRLSPTDADDLFAMSCGKVLGEGAFRRVYEWRYDDTLVVKRQITTGATWDNILEATFWKSAEHTPLAKWLAPVIDVSPNGRFLLMKKTQPLMAGPHCGGIKIPRKVPAIFDDVCERNWGYLDGRVVCHDYAINAAVSEATDFRRMQTFVRD